MSNVDEAASLDELEAEFGKQAVEVKDVEPLMGAAHLATSKRKPGGKKDESAAKAFFASSRFLVFAFVFMAVIGFGTVSTFEEESSIENDKYGVVEDEGVMEKRQDEKREKAEMRFERAEASKTNRAIINDAYEMCKEMQHHTLSAAQNQTLVQYATTLGYKEATLCQSVTQFLHEADFFKEKKGNTGVTHPQSCGAAAAGTAPLAAPLCHALRRLRRLRRLLELDTRWR